MRRAVRLSLAAVTVVAASMTVFLVLSGSQASAACGDEGAAGEVSLLCVKPTTTTTTLPETTSTLPTTTTVPPSTTTVPEKTTTTLESTTTTLASTTTSIIPTEVLPTVITTSTTSTTAEVGGIEVLPFTGYSNGALLGLAISLLALGTIAVCGGRRSRSEE